MKIKNSFKEDESGQVSVAQVIVIGILMIILWQFVAPYLGIISFSETIGISEEDPEELYFSASLFNVDLGDFRYPDGNLTDEDPDPRLEHEDLLLSILLFLQTLASS